MAKLTLHEREPALDEPSLLLSVKEAEHLLGIGVTSTYGPLASGELAGVRVLDRHLIKRATVEVYIASRRASSVVPLGRGRRRRLA